MLEKPLMEFIFSKWQLEAFNFIKMNFFVTNFSGYYQDF